MVLRVRRSLVIQTAEFLYVEAHIFGIGSMLTWPKNLAGEGIDPYAGRRLGLSLSLTSVT